MLSPVVGVVYWSPSFFNSLSEDWMNEVGGSGRVFNGWCHVPDDGV